MDKRIVTFGKSGQFGNGGQLSHYPSTVYKTTGLAGIIQPYQVFVRDQTGDGPYEERSHYSTDNQDPTKFSSELRSTEYIKGHGENESANKGKQLTGQGSSSDTKAKVCQCQSHQEPFSDKASDTAHDIVEGAAKAPLKISEVEFKRKTAHLEAREAIPKKKKKSHKFSLY